jgi:hypothetical protein
MRDTVWAIIITQTPIAVACFWVAWEARGIRNALARLVLATERLRPPEGKA